MALPPDPALLLAQQLPLLDEVARSVARRGGSRAADQQEFVDRARLKMVEDDYAELRRFEGRSSLRTYLTVVLQRLFLDERVRRWGRWRLSAVARRMGPAAQRIDILVRRDGLGADEAWHTVTQNEGWALTRAEFEAVAAEVVARERGQQAAHTCAALRCALAALTAEERVILKLRYQDDLRVGAVARALSLPEKPLFRRIERLRARLRVSLEQQGARAGDLVPLLGEDASYAGPTATEEMHALDRAL
jgi:RNA polymerase sigma factor (sigma-70 family)